VLLLLVGGLPVLVVAFAVLMAGEALARATQDAAGARVLLWIAMGVLMLLATDVLLLVGALGINALARREPPEE
jgi:hypothetical protein